MTTTTSKLSYGSRQKKTFLYELDESVEAIGDTLLIDFRKSAEPIVDNGFYYFTILQLTNNSKQDEKLHLHLEIGGGDSIYDRTVTLAPGQMIMIPTDKRWTKDTMEGSYIEIL
jgi:hypothetical protein